DPLDPQDVVRVDRALGEAVARPHRAALLDVEVLALGDLVLAGVAVLAAHDQLAHAARDATELHAPVDLGHDRRVLRPPRLEQLRDAGQAARDVAGLRGLAAGLDQRVSPPPPLARHHPEGAAGR